MSFCISGLDPAAFLSLHQMSDAELAGRGVRRVRVAESPGAPCRITLDDAAVGEHVLLLSHTHQHADTPYHQQGPIFVSAAASACVAENAIPPALARRPLSLRAYDSENMMIDADLVEGAVAAGLIARLFANSDVAYIHAHYARRGCYAALIERA